MNCDMCSNDVMILQAIYVNGAVEPVYLCVDCLRAHGFEIGQVQLTIE